jgi:hypothetical protein
MTALASVTWTPLPGGPHEGMTLPEVLFIDPDYVFHGVEHGKFAAWLPQAREVCLRATRIRPHRDRREVLVLYHLHGAQFSGVSVVARNDPRLVRYRTFAAAGSAYLDLLMVRCLAPEDPTALKAMVQRVLMTHFGHPNAKLTREQAESFFNDPRCISLGEE